MEQTQREPATGETPENTRHGETERSHLRYLMSVAVTITIGCLGLAIVLSPEFALHENALSDLGVTWTDAGTTATAVLFNGGLITGGIIGVTIAVSGFRQLTRRGDRAVLALAGTALGAMSLVGVFPRGETAHFPVAIVFFLLVSVTLWVDGSLLYRAGERVRGVLVVAGGTANIAGWVVWFAVVENPSEGLAVPELVGALVFSAWLVTTATRLFDA